MDCLINHPAKPQKIILQKDLHPFSGEVPSFVEQINTCHVHLAMQLLVPLSFTVTCSARSILRKSGSYTGMWPEIKIGAASDLL